MNNHLKYKVDFLLEQPKINIQFGGSILSYLFNQQNINPEQFYIADGIYLNNIYDGIDFVYKPYFAELKEEIIVHSKEALLNLEMQIECVNCVITKEDKAYYVVEKQEKIWQFMPLYAIDTEGNETLDVELKLQYIGNNKYSVNFLISSEWLKQAVFPIVIDPIISLVFGSDINLIYTDDIYAKLSVPIRSPEPTINDGANITNKTDVYIQHTGITGDIEDYSIRNWDAEDSYDWSKWFPINDNDVWQLEILPPTDPVGQEPPELRTIEVKYRLSTVPAYTPQEEEVGNTITTIEEYRWLERYRNTIGGEILSIVAYGNDIYIGSKIPYGNDFQGSLWKFNGKYFTFISYFKSIVNGNKINVFPYVMKVIGSSIYIGAGRDDDIEGAGTIFRYNESNGVILASVLGGSESKVTALNAFMENIYVGTKENRVYKYDLITQWSLAFDLSFEDDYQGIEDIATLNGIYLSVYDGTNSIIYYYDNISLNKIYILFNEHIYSINVIPATHNDIGACGLYLHTEDKIFRLEKQKENQNNAVFEQMESTPNSPWLRSYIDLLGKTVSSYNKINSAAIPLPTEVFLPTIVGNNGYIATFNDKETLQISSAVTTENLNDVAFARRPSYYQTNGFDIQFNSEDYFYGTRAGDQMLYKSDSNGNIVGSTRIDNIISNDIIFAIGEDDNILYMNTNEDTLNIMDKNFRFKKSMGIDFTPSYFMQYNSYDGYLYINATHRIKVYDLSQERVVRTIGDDNNIPSSQDGYFSFVGQKAFDENYIYAVDTNNNRVQKFDLSGTFISKWGSYGTGNGQFKSPVGIVLVGDYLYVTDKNNSRIQKFDKDGNFVSVLVISIGTDSGKIYHPAGITTDSSGALYVVERKVLLGEVNRIQKFSVTGTFIAQFLRDGATPTNYVNENLAFIVGDNGTYLTSTDGGYTYAVVVPTGDPFGTNNLTSISINRNDIDYMLITDSSGNIYVSTDRGVNWTKKIINVSYAFYNSTFYPWSNNFTKALVVGSYNSYPLVISLNGDASSHTVEVSGNTFTDPAYPSYSRRAISVSYDNKGWLDSSYSNGQIFVATDSGTWGVATANQRLVIYDGDWKLQDANLGVWCTDVYAYGGKVMVVGLNFAVVSDDNGYHWHDEEMGVQNYWQRVFYYGDSYQGYAIGNFYQDTNAQRPWQKAPIRRFEPSYENWPVYKSASDTIKKYFDVIATGTIEDTFAPDGTDYGYIIYTTLNILDSSSYQELSENSYIIIADSESVFVEDKAYKIIDVNLGSTKIVLDEIPNGFVADAYNNCSFYIVNGNNIKNSLLITSPVGTTVLFSHDVSGTKWYDNVNNTDGWVVEFSMSLIDGASAYTTDPADPAAYQGVKIADGSKYAVLRIYKAKVILVIENNTYTFDSTVTTSIANGAGFSNIFTNGTTHDRLHTYTVRGWGSNIEVYIDGIKIKKLSGTLLLSSTTDKSLEFGDLSGTDLNSAAKWAYIYYKTDKDFSYSTNLLNTFASSSEVKQIFHTPYVNYNNFQENVFDEDFLNILWAHNTNNTPWVDRASNTDGWIVEFVITNTAGTSSSFYDRVRAYDGTHSLELRFYHGGSPYVNLFIGNSFYSFTSVGDEYNTIFGPRYDSEEEEWINDLGRTHTFRLEAQGTQLRCYIDNVLVDELSGNILNSSTLQKFVDFGNNSGVQSSDSSSNWGIIRYYLSSYSTSVFDVYNNTQYQTYWTYIKETTASVTTADMDIHNTDLEGWYLLTQTDEPDVKMYINKLNNNEDLSTLFSKNIFYGDKLKYYEDISSEIGQVNDVLGFSYIDGDKDSYKMLFAGRDVVNDDALVQMVRYGHHFTDIILDYYYGYPQYSSDIYISPMTIDKNKLVSKIYVVAQGRNELKSKIYVYNNSVAVFFYKDYALTIPLDNYQGVSVADFNTSTKKVYMKIVYYTPKSTPPTVYLNQQGSVDVTLNTERIDAFSFRTDYTVNAQSPNDYLDGFAAITVYD